MHGLRLPGCHGLHGVLRPEPCHGQVLCLPLQLLLLWLLWLLLRLLLWHPEMGGQSASALLERQIVVEISAIELRGYEARPGLRPGAAVVLRPVHCLPLVVHPLDRASLAAI